MKTGQRGANVEDAVSKPAVQASMHNRPLTKTDWKRTNKAVNTNARSAWLGAHLSQIDEGPYTTRGNAAETQPPLSHLESLRSGLTELIRK